MNRREIIKATINHQATAVTPYCIPLADDAKTKYGKELAERYMKPEFQKGLDQGVLTFSEALSLSFGNYMFETVDKPWWSWHNAAEEFTTDFDPPGYLPQTIGTGNYERFANKLKFVKDHSDCYILIMVYGSHIEKASFLRGIEFFLADMAGNPEFAKKTLDFIIRKNLVMLENMLGFEEIDGILLGSDWGSQQSLLMSPQTWEEMIAPGEKQEYDLIKSAGKDVWIHSCGNIELILPRLIEMGVDVLNPIQPEAMDIAKIKAEYGDKLSFWGGISTQQTLPYGTPEQVKKEARQVWHTMSPNGGYILAPAQEIQSDVPLENIVALLEIAQEGI